MGCFNGVPCLFGFFNYTKGDAMTTGSDDFDDGIANPEALDNAVAPRSGSAGKRKSRLPLVEVLVGSLILHLVAAIMLGGYVIWTVSAPVEEPFVPPPDFAVVEPVRLEYQVKMRKQMKQSSSPRQPRIQVQMVTDIPIQTIDISTPVQEAVAVVGNGLRGNAGSGDGMTGGGSPVGIGEVVIFKESIRTEKLYFIVDASKYMLTDDKGGYPAFQVIKDEFVGLTDKMPPGMLFNGVLYSGDSVSRFSDGFSPLRHNTREELVQWLAPVNTDAANAGHVEANYSPDKTDFDPLGEHTAHWLRGMQVAMEDGADAIFLLVTEWQWFSRQLSEEEKRVWLKEEKGWDEKKEAQWQEDSAKAWEWLAEENRKRREAGQPERVVKWVGDLTQELFGYQKPDPAFSEDEILEQVEAMLDYYYKEQGMTKPGIYVVMYAGKGKKDALKKGDNPDFNRFKRLARLGSPGKIKIIEGMAELQNVTQRPASVYALSGG